MSYGDWVRREAAVRGIRPRELEQKLDVEPLRVHTVSPWPFKLAQRKYNNRASDFDAVTDFREGFAPGFNVPFLRILPVYQYWMSGTGIKILDNSQFERISIDKLDMSWIRKERIEPDEIVISVKEI